MATTTVSHGSITLTRIKDGSQFWTSSAEPAIPDYTFTISNLVGDTNADIRIGDIVYYGHYKYTVTSVGSDGTTVLCGNRESLRGAEGVSPTIKSIACSHSAAICEKDGTYNPDTITFSGQSQFKESITSYEGWFVIELSSDGVNWVSSYSSTGKEPYVDYKIPLGINITKDGIIYNQGSDVTSNGSIIDSAFTISSDGVITTNQGIGFIIRSIRCSLYSDANKTNLIDQQRVNIAFDGVDGDKGDDGYTVILTNENHTFSGDTRGAVESDQSTGFNVAECSVIAYIGDTQIPCTIGSITGMPVGMPTPLIYNNSTTAARFTVLVTYAMTSQNGTLNIPVTLNGGTSDEKTFNMKFTYSLKLNGLDATGLSWKVNYSSLTTPNDGECFYHGFDEATKEASADRSVHAWVLWNGQEIIIPTGCYVNPDATMPFNTPIYSVYRLPSPTAYTNGTFHDVAWVESSNTWVSNTYNGVNPSVDQNPWFWNEATDIILAIYKISGDESPITDAQLFTPPKKYSELVEPAKEMAKDAEKVATNYLAVDNTGIMVADMKDGRQTPSTATGNNVFIDSNSVDIRSGTDTLASFTGDGTKFYDIDASKEIASFGATTRIGTADGRNIIIGSQSLDIMSGENSLASFSQNVRVGRDTLPHMAINPTNISAYKGNGDLYFQVGDGSATAYQTYNVDALPIELTLDNPIYDLTSVLINNQQVSDYSFYINETSVSIDDRPPEAITIVVNYQYEVTDYSESTDETTTQIVTTSQTFEYPKIDLSIPLEYPDIYITNVTPSILDGTFSYDDNNIIFSPRPQSGTVINIEYYLNQSARQPYFTFNGRNSNGEVGSGSISLANNGVASGESSFVTGIDSSTTGKASFSSGEYNNSSGEAGSTMGKNLNNNAIGGMAIGTYNVQSPNSIFTVGNGTSDLDRRNALTVASNGNSIFAGRLFSGTHANDAKPMFKVETINFTSIGIGSGRGYGAERKINRNGYIPIAIAGFQILDNQPNGKYSLWCVPTRVYIDYVSNNYVLRFYIWNQHSSEMAIVRFVAKVLYIASSAL